MRHPSTHASSRHASSLRYALALLLALSSVLVAHLDVALASVPTSVTMAGSFQNALGCPGDWAPDCAATYLTYDSSDGVWKGTWTIPAGTYSYKAAIDNSWDENYGVGGVLGGTEIDFVLASSTTVKFYYDPITHWVTDSENSRIVTAAGSFQSALGCPGDWAPDCLRTWLQDAGGSGTYSLTTTALPVGSYEGKAAINEAWDENYGAGGVPGGANIAFTVTSFGQPVTFSFKSSTNTLTVTIADTSPPSVADVAVTLRQGGRVSTAPVLVSWSASDDLTSDSALRNQVQIRRYAHGAWRGWKPGQTVTGQESLAWVLPNWREFQFRVRARDEAGNWSDWTVSNTILVVRRQERHFTVDSGWTSMAMTNAMKGHVAVSSTVGATASLSFVGNGVAAVMPAHAGYGVAQVCVDPGTGGEQCTTVNLATFAPSGDRRVVASFDDLADGAHALQVKVVSGQVRLDGALISRPGVPAS